MRAQITGTPLPTTVQTRRIARTTRLEVQAAIKKSSLRNIVCSKTLKVKEGFAEQAKELCTKLANVAHEEMKDKETGILAFEVFQDPFEEKFIHFWERYSDNARMGRFNTSDNFQKFMKEIQECLDEPVGLALYDWKDGQLGPLAVQGGPKGEGGLDDATGAGGRGASSYAQTSDVVNLADFKRGDEGDSFGLEEEEEKKKKKKPLFQLPKIKLPWDN